LSEEDLSLMKAVTDLVSVALARMQSAERLRRAAEDLARSNKDLEQFAYVASHDLKEPLRAVGGFVALLEAKYREMLDEKACGYIAHAVEGTNRMALLLDGLLEYSRVDSRAGRGAGRVSTFPAREAVAAALAGLASTMEESLASVTVEELPAVTADRTQLTQVFQNLIANALKFHRRETPPVVVVGARLQGQEWVFSVRDKGIGIDPEYFDRIFVIFRRLHTRKTYPGTGIGLAIVKKIVERHGGRVWLESRVGEGTTFFFSLPAAGTRV
jgi:light-regulated signal transduction histidine kinase (bacteriophytochrome)